MLLYLFISFFFILYIILECTKYSAKGYVKGDKKKKTYHAAIVYLKLITICIVLLLVIINRFTKNGIVERSSKTSVSFLFIFLFIGISVYDLFKYKKSLKKGETEI